MTMIPFAFSVHHFISTVGADAGFAAIIGLAILVLLYFAQARETKALRDQAADTADHVQQLEQRVAQLSRVQPANSGTTSWPAPAVASVPAPAGIVRRPAAPVMAVPAAPAGVGAPALTAATRLIPAVEDPEVAAGVGAGVAAGATPGVMAQATGMAPAPATSAGGGNGLAAQRVARPAGVPPGRPAVPPPRRPPPDRPQRSGVSRGFLLAGGLLAVVAVVAMALILTSGGGHGASTTVSTSARATSAAKTRHRTPPVVTKPSAVTVAVLNGTTTANLAHTIALKLGAAGFKQGMITDSSDQTETATVVGYLPGHRQDALTVAASLKLGSASVQPVDQSNQAAACPPPAACTANVVVTVGSDLASTT
jgi:LytR cell envelope-related transcriptional attenuator